LELRKEMGMKYFNRKGDEGYTSLLYGERIRKYDPRPDAYGTLDEANSALGLARAFCQKEKIRELIFDIQRKLFIVGEEIATDVGKIHLLKRRITPEMVDEIEKRIDELEEIVTLPQRFIIPGDTPSSSAMDLARTFVRRAERKVHKLRADNLLKNQDIPRFMNRLADLLFILARFEEQEAGV
jgi:cob(I)alamin adenosyltransferase